MFYYKYDNNSKLETIIRTHESNKSDEVIWEKQLGQLLLDFLNTDEKLMERYFSDLGYAAEKDNKAKIKKLLDFFNTMPLLTYEIEKSLSIRYCDYYTMRDAYNDIFIIMSLLKLFINACNDLKLDFTEKTFNIFRDFISEEIAEYSQIGYPPETWNLYNNSEYSTKPSQYIEKFYHDSVDEKTIKEIYDYFVKRLYSNVKEPSMPFDMYECKNGRSCYVFSFEHICKNEILIKKCKNCDKYFIPLNRSDTLYCDGTAPQDNNKTCKKYGAEKQYQENLKNDDVANRYRQTYMKLQMLVKRNPDMTNYKNKYEEFKQLSKQWKNDVKTGEKSREEYLQWINTY